MHVFSVISAKGGVGKTAAAANLGSLLADAGKRVLLLDSTSSPPSPTTSISPTKPPAASMS
jgi:chromosome partitioning related protein ParA